MRERTRGLAALLPIFPSHRDSGLRIKAPGSTPPSRLIRLCIMYHVSHFHATASPSHLPCALPSVPQFPRPKLNTVFTAGRRGAARRGAYGIWSRAASSFQFLPIFQVTAYRKHLASRAFHGCSRDSYFLGVSTNTRSTTRKLSHLKNLFFFIIYFFNFLSNKYGSSVFVICGI
jgi:hypothetical protein